MRNKKIAKKKSISIINIYIYKKKKKILLNKYLLY